MKNDSSVIIGSTSTITTGSMIHISVASLHHRCRPVSRGLYDHRPGKSCSPKTTCVVSHDFFLADPGAALDAVARFYGLAEYDLQALGCTLV